MEEYFDEGLFHDITQQVNVANEHDPVQKRHSKAHYIKYLNETSIGPISKLVMNRVTQILESNIKEFWNHINKILETDNDT